MKTEIKDLTEKTESNSKCCEDNKNKLDNPIEKKEEEKE
jgi:hypothetical protein